MSDVQPDLNELRSALAARKNAESVKAGSVAEFAARDTVIRVWPEIRQSLQNGASHHDICLTLKQHGTAIKVATFRAYISILRHVDRINSEQRQKAKQSHPI